MEWEAGRQAGGGRFSPLNCYHAFGGRDCVTASTLMELHVLVHLSLPPQGASHLWFCPQRSVGTADASHSC